MSGIDNLVEERESEKLEFKRSLAERDEILETIAAFANTRGGTILIGVDDQGHVIGVDLKKGDLESLENSINQLIEPRVYPDIEIIPHNNKLVLKIGVQEGFNKPYFYRGACYVRKSSVTRRLDRNGILEVISRRVTFDALVFEGEYEISEDLVEDFLKKARERRMMRIEPEDVQLVLKKLNLLEKGRVRNGALLLFSRECSSHFPQAVVKIGFLENDKIVDEALIEGPLQVQLEEAMAFIQKHIRKGYVVKGLERVETWEYPLESIREALVNALLHRDYFSSSHVSVKIGESGITVENPGELPPPLEIEDLCREHPSIPRNPLISRAFFYMGYFEEWGSGTLRMINSLRKSGLPDPEFSQGRGFFRVWIRSLKSLEKDLNENERRLLDFIRARKKVNRRDCELLLNLSERSVRRALSKLEGLGLIKRIGSGRRITYETIGS
ncbi:MAG: putative DNA binding domain-containing protein [Crenarchaeota archaeon]|nr:putative DNA binding domain-containing protein [Thermoproteota archaeon]